MRKRIAIFLRFFFALMLLVAAIGKLLDNRHFAEILREWQVFPEWSLLWVGLLASLSELVISVWLLSGRYLAQAALVTFGFHLVYSLMTLLSISRGIFLPDCGCFGVFFPHPLDWVMFWEDLVLTFLALWLFNLVRSPAKNEKESISGPNERLALL